MISEVKTDLRKVFDLLKIRQSHVAADDAVMINDVASRAQFVHENSR